MMRTSSQQKGQESRRVLRADAGTDESPSELLKELSAVNSRYSKFNRFSPLSLAKDSDSV